MQLSISVLWARMTRSLTLSAKSCTLANSDSPMVWIVFGIYPYISSNGAKLVDSLMLELRANSTAGSVNDIVIIADMYGDNMDLT
jgi:hypothetical protein